MKRRIIALFLVLLALAATLGVRALTSPALERFLRDELSALAREQLGAAIIVGQVDHNFLLTRLSLYDIVLTGPGGGAGKPLAIRRIEAAIDPFSPLRGRLSFREVRVEGADIRVERLPGGAWQVEPFAPFPLAGQGGSGGGGKGGDGGGLSARVDSLSLLDAAVAFRDRELGVDASLSGVMLNLRRRILDPEGRTRVAFGAREGRLAAGGAGLDQPLPIRSLQGRLVVDPGEVTVESLSLLLGPASLLFSGKVPLADGPLDGSAAVGFDLGELPWRTGFAGRVTLEGRVRGELATPSFRGVLAGRSIAAGESRFDDLRGDLALDGKGASLGALSLRFRGETVRGEMAVAFAGGLPFRARGDIAAFPLHKLLGLEEAATPLKGAIDARAEVTGRLSPAPGEEGLAIGVGGGGSLVLDALSGRSRAFSFRADGLLRDGTLAVTRGSASSKSFALNASGTASSIGPRFSLTLADPSLSGWSSSAGWAKGLDGALDLSATVAGSWKEPVAKGDVRLSRPGWGGYRADLVQARVEADGRGVRTSLATIRAGRSALGLYGELPWKGAEGGRVRLSLSPGRLEDVLLALGGGLRGEGELSGVFEAVSSPAGWSGKGEVTGRGVKVEGEAADLVRAPFRLAQGRLTLEQALLEREGKGLLLSGKAEGGAFELALETREPFPLEQVAVFTAIRAPLGGEVAIRAQARGRFDDLRETEVDAAVASSALFYGGKSWRGARADIRIRKKNLAAEGTLFDGRITSRVSLGLLGEIPFHGDLSCERLTRADLNDFLQLGLPDTVQGEVSATLGAEGFLVDTQTTRVTGTIEKARFSVSELAFISQKPAPFTYHPPDGVAFTGLVLKTGESVLRGDVRIGRAGELGGAIKGEIDIAGFPFLKPTVTDFAGRCTVELVAGGTVGAPRFEGYADLADVSCTAHLPFPLVCRGFSGRIEVLRDRLRFNGVSGEAGGGRLGMEGDLYFRGAVPYRGQLTFTGERVAIAFPEGLNTRARASITLAFVEGKGNLRGTILADESRYRMKVDLENLLGLLRDMRREKPSSEGGGGEGEWLTLDLQMETVNPIDADLKILRGKANGSLRLQGTAARPLLGGRLDISPATIEYRGHVFTVTRGWVGFFNPRVIEPSFDVRSRATVSGLDAQGVYRDFTVDMSVIGTPAKVDLSFLSDPPLSKLDVIGLLTWGSVTSRMLGAGQGFPTAQAALLLTSQLKGNIESGVQNLIGFDRFVINPAQTSATGERDVWVQVDKRLGDRLRLTYAAPVGRASNAGQEVELRYRVTDVFSILGSQKGESSLGVDLDFSLEIP